MRSVSIFTMIRSMCLILILLVVYQQEVFAWRLGQNFLKKRLEPVISSSGVRDAISKFHIPNKVSAGLFHFEARRQREIPEIKPDFCHGLDCPEFTVLNKTDNYEERLYKKSNWVSTNMQGISYDSASSELFQRLFEYIQGKNSKKQEIAMTAPVTVELIPGQGPACESNFTMSFFMSPSITDPPAPTDQTVFLNSRNAQRVFVKSFGGMATEGLWVKNAKELATALLKDRQMFEKDFFYSAGYDSPYKIIGRHNEVWYMAK